jgi:hypothetical protein
MNTQTKILNIAGALALSLMSTLPSQAEPGSARFSFAPNVWKQEQARMPQPEHSVRDGSVPVGSKFLGLDPQMLAKPKLPQVAVRPAFTQVTPQMLPPKGQFDAAFGTPESLPTQAKKAEVPKVAQAQSLPLHNQAHSPRRAVSRGGHAKTAVHAQLVNKPKATGLAAPPAEQIASYDKNFGYVPGSFLPSSASDGLSRHTEVQGKLLRH